MGKIPFISEEIIDQISVRLEEESRYEAAVAALQEEQPIVTGWLFSESFDLFTQPEREYLLYLVLVLFQSIKEVEPELAQPDEDLLSQLEEDNWKQLGTENTHAFHERLDTFFEQTSQEDLLAFAEDALSDFEDEFVTKEGREALFVVLKTIIDGWTGDQV